MEEIIRRILEAAATGFAGDQVMKRTGLGERAEGILDKIIPPAAAADASAIPQEPAFKPMIEDVPADRVMTQEEEQLVTPRVDLGGGRVGLPTITMQEPTEPAMVDVTDDARKNEVQDFVRMVGGRTQNLLGEIPEEARANLEVQKGAAALATTEGLAAKGMEMPDEPMDLGAPVVGPKDVAMGQFPMSMTEFPRGEAKQESPGFFDQAGSFLSDLFGDEERMTRMALAFNSMRLQPDQGLAKVLGKRLETLGTSRKANRTADALRKIGTPAAIKAAEYIEATGDAKGGYKMYNQAGQFVTGSGKELMETYGITGLIPNRPYRYNTVTKKVEGVGGGDTIFEATKPSKGFQFVRDDSGKILYEEPIPKKLTPERAGTKIQSADLVLDEMNRLTSLIQESPMTTTGFGTLLSSIPTTSARDAQALAGTIKANIGFDRLQRMREESPTGGALGQVAVQELQALQSTLGSLDLGQSTEAVLYNVNRLKQQYAKTMLALADSQPNFNEYFPDFDRKAYEDILKGSTAKQTTKPSITPEQAKAELARRRGQ